MKAPQISSQGRSSYSEHVAHNTAYHSHKKNVTGTDILNIECLDSCRRPLSEFEAMTMMTRATTSKEVKRTKMGSGKMSEVGFEPTPTEVDCDLNAAP